MGEMESILNGNSKIKGEHRAVCKLQTKAARNQVAGFSHGIKESRVSFRTHEEIELRGTLVRTTRLEVIFELSSPSIIPQLSDALDEFKISFQDRVIYSGRAIIRNLVDLGTKMVCEATLDESCWKDVDTGQLARSNGQIVCEFKSFLREWQKLYKVLPEFKVVVADMQMFFYDLRLWLEQIELGIHSLPLHSRTQIAESTLEHLAGPVIHAIDNMIDRFESIVVKFEDSMHPAHRAHLRRHLHPLILTSPFAHRAFTKPLGYAGDYQVVDMMIRSPVEGNNFFSKIVNIWLLRQAPAQAHRNRVDFLEKRLTEEAMRVGSLGQTARILNLGCGPAAEVQRFISNQNNCKAVDITLVDFNQETLDFLRKKLEETRRLRGGRINCRWVKKSVNQILIESARDVGLKASEQFDFIYCAGLFDYLSDKVCKQLMNIFYANLAPGGLLLATNVTDALNVSRPFRYSMEYILDWHLIYRDATRFRKTAPDIADDHQVAISGEATGANLFLEIRKPKYA
jgi:extracellular factor (EF) 3-hydroxypalmitic acid methyl ester biosynthesis protein